MLNNHQYVNEKLQTLHTERLDVESSRPSRHLLRRRPFGGAMFSAAGRAMRRLGEGIERWAAMEPQTGSGATRGPVRYGGSNDLEPCTDCP